MADSLTLCFTLCFTLSEAGMAGMLSDAEYSGGGAHFARQSQDDAVLYAALYAVLHARRGRDGRHAERR